jgi:DNA-binding response OmpR family regulator
MNLSRRILIVHTEARARRRLVLILVEAGYDVRAYGATEEALAGARGEWFDLALVDYALPGGEGFGFTRTLRQVQPTLPIIMLLPSLELPLIIEGIRLGLTDVLPSEEDPRPVLRRVNGLLRSGVNQPTDLTPEELAEVDELLARFGNDPAVTDPADAAPDPTVELRQELAAALRVRHDLEAQLERVLREKAAATNELNTVLQQNGDVARLQAETAQLESQRQVLRTTQAALEEKSRQLVEMRAQLAAERAAWEEAQKTSRPAGPTLSDETLALERAHLAAVRDDLREEEGRLREEWSRVRQESTQLSHERRRWHDELDQLREREDNLRMYEQRLRAMQAQLDAGGPRVPSVLPGANVPAVVPPEAVLRAEWEKIHRANQLMEAERAQRRDERMTLQELEKMIHQREERLRQIEEQVAARQSLARGLADGTAGPKAARGGAGRAPFGLWGKSSS